MLIQYIQNTFFLLLAYLPYLIILMVAIYRKEIGAKTVFEKAFFFMFMSILSINQISNCFFNVNLCVKKLFLPNRPAPISFPPLFSPNKKIYYSCKGS